MKTRWYAPTTWLADWPMKLGAVAIALVMWAWVRNEATMVVTMNVPLEIMSPPQTMRMVRRPPASLLVRMQVPRNVAPLVSTESVAVVADLSGVRGRKVSISLTADDVRRPAGVNILDITPSQVELEFEPRRD